MPVEKGILLVCGKTGRVVGVNRKYRWARWFLPVIGLAALIWYLVRVIPKPIRASYPCQQVGAPIAFGGLVYLLSFFGLVTAFRKTRQFLLQHRYAAACGCVAIGAVCFLVFHNLNVPNALAEDTGTFTPSDNPNQPVGTARGINPGRVSWAYDLAACTWNGSSSYWHSSNYNSQARITAMMNKTICSVAGQPSIPAAWETLFRNKNGGTNYVKGEKITIKLNLNNGGNYDNQIDASPQTVYALLDGLVNQFGVNQADITLCDPARENQCSAVSDYCRGAFPNVNYDSNLGGFVANAFAYSASGPTERSLSASIVNARYLITLAILKRHCTPASTYGTDGVDYGNASVTMIFKSCWGIIGNNRASQHGMLHDWSYTMASYNQLVDMFGCKHVDGKTVINIIDGLYSGDRWNSSPRRWALPPFNNNWPSSIFVSQDPVALESVGLDFLRAEMPLIKNADRHLHEAAQANNPPSGTVYQPDGVRLASLGVHEHWNNATNKQYSRNLGTGSGIELVTINPNPFYVEMSSPTNRASFTPGAGIPLQAVITNATNPIVRVDFYQGYTQLIATVSNSPYASTWTNAALGSWTLTAVGTDNAGRSVTSNPVNISVNLAPVTWDSSPAVPGSQDGNGSWNLSTSNWWTGTTNTSWPAILPINTLFGSSNGTAGMVTLETNITVGNMTFNPASSGNYTITNSNSVLTFSGTPVITVATNLSPMLAVPLAGAGFSKAGSGVLILSGDNAYSGTITVNGGTLAVSGNNTGATAGITVSAGAVLKLAHPNALKNVLTLNNGSILQLRADTNTVFTPGSIVLQSASDTLTFDVNSITPGVTSRALTLSGNLAYGYSSDQTINVTGNSTYRLNLGAISATASSHSPYLNININALPAGPTVGIASFTAGNYGNYLVLKGGGRVIITGKLSNTSNGSTILFVKEGTTATLLGPSTKVNTGDAYSYYVESGSLVVVNSSALINNTTGAGLNQSWFVLGVRTNTVANASAAAILLGDTNMPNGGITVAANVTNLVADGGAAYPNTGAFVLGGQNTNGVNTFANRIILGYTTNRGKSVTLLAAPGGTVDFTGGLHQNGTDVTAGITVGNTLNTGVIRLSASNTYAGATVVNAGTLLVNGVLASTNAVTVAGGTLGGTGVINGPVSIQGNGTLSPGTVLGTLSLSNNLVLAGNLTIDINKSLSPSGDKLVIAGILTNAGTGTLTITNRGTAYAPGDTFALFNKPLLNGNALSISPAQPGPGLGWVNTLHINGKISITSVPTNTVTMAAGVSNGSLILSWPMDQLGWTLKVQTNPPGVGLGSNWMTINGTILTNQFFFPVNQTNGAIFFRLGYP